MNTIKKILYLCTALTMTLSLGSCNDNSSEKPLLHDNSSSSLSDSKQRYNKAPKITQYYDQIPIDVSKEMDSIRQIKYSGDKIYLLGQKCPENNYSMFSTDLNTLETVPLGNENTDPDKDKYDEIFHDNKGNTYKSNYSGIEVYDTSGKLIKKIDDEFFSGNDDIRKLFIYSSTVSENGEIYIAVSDKTPENIRIIKINSSFEIEYITQKGDFSDCGSYTEKIFIGQDGNPVLCTQLDMTYINVLSPENGKTTLRYELPLFEEFIGAYGNNSLIYRNGNTIYGYDYLNDNSTEL